MRAVFLCLGLCAGFGAGTRAPAQDAPPGRPVVAGRPILTAPAGHTLVFGSRFLVAVPDTIAGLVRTPRRIDYADRALGTLLRYAAPADPFALDLYLYPAPLPPGARTCSAACADSAAIEEMRAFATVLPLSARSQGLTDLVIHELRTLAPAALATWYSGYDLRLTFSERQRPYTSHAYVFAMDGFLLKVRASYPSAWRDGDGRAEAFALAAAAGVRPPPFDAPLPICRAGAWRDAPVQVDVTIDQPPDTLSALLRRAVAELGYTTSRADTMFGRLVTVPRFAADTAVAAAGAPSWRTLLDRAGHGLLFLIREGPPGGTRLSIVGRVVCEVPHASPQLRAETAAALDSAAREVLRRMVALSGPPER